MISYGLNGDREHTNIRNTIHKIIEFVVFHSHHRCRLFERDSDNALAPLAAQVCRAVSQSSA